MPSYVQPYDTHSLSLFHIIPYVTNFRQKSDSYFAHEWLLFTPNVIKLAPQPSREGNKMLKKPLKKRRHLVRSWVAKQLANLVPATLFLERKRGDGAFYSPHGVRHR